MSHELRKKRLVPTEEVKRSVAFVLTSNEITWCEFSVYAVASQIQLVNGKFDYDCTRGLPRVWFGHRISERSTLLSSVDTPKTLDGKL